MRRLILLNTNRSWPWFGEQNIDITHFEEDLDAFKVAFAKNYNSASTNFGKAIDEIDKAIKRMEEVKKFLTTSETNSASLTTNWKMFRLKIDS